MSEVENTEVETEETESQTTDSKESGLSISDALDIAMEEHGVTEDGEEPASKPQKQAVADPKTAKQPAKEALNQQTQAPEAESVGEPKWWTKDERKAFASVPPEVKKIILAKEQQMVDWAHRHQSSVAQAANRYKALDETFEPYRTKLMRHGLDDVSAMRRFLGWQDAMEKDPVGTLRELASTLGVSPENLMQTGQQEQEDPRFVEMQKTVQEMREMFEMQQRQAAESHQATIASDIQAFKTQTDENGNLLRPHVDLLEPQIAQLVAQYRAANPQASNYQILDAAYNQVMEQFGQTLIQPQVQQVQQSQMAAIQQKAQAARRASASLPSNSGSITAPRKPKSTRDALDMAFETHGL